MLNFFFWYSILGSKDSIFFDYRLSVDVRNWFRQASSQSVCRRCADVSLVVPSAPRPRDPLQLHLLQHWCIPPTATVWHIQALARRTVARGVMDQRLLRRRTGAHLLRRDKADIERHPTADMLLGGPTDKPGKWYHWRVNWKWHTESWNLTLIDEAVSVFQQAYIKASNRTFTVQTHYAQCQ